MSNYLIAFLAVMVFSITSHGLSSALAEQPCGDWIPYKNEKCVKFVDRAGYQTKEDAEVVCNAYSTEFQGYDTPKLIEIKTEEEQNFFNDLLFEKMESLDNVWLGLNMGENGVFHWKDGTELFFMNWAVDVVQGLMADHERNCVQMESGEGVIESGKWVRVYCKKKNAVVCERNQPLTTSALQNIVLSLKLEMERNKQEFNQKLTDSKKEAEKNVNVAKQEAEQKINKTRQEAEKMVTEVKKDTEDKINEARQEAEKMVTEVKKNTEDKINEARQEAEKMVAEVKEDAENKINEVRQEAEKRTNETIQKINDSNQKIMEVNTEIASLKANPVPVGFIYVQLPGQTSPTSLWPHVTWEDVGPQYAGLFFRVVGGGAAPFGQEQQDNTRNLRGVSNTDFSDNWLIDPLPTDGSWSSYLHTGNMEGREVGVRFRFRAGEIRPRNKAVKIWRRIK